MYGVKTNVILSVTKGKYITLKRKRNDKYKEKRCDKSFCLFFLCFFFELSLQNMLEKKICSQKW
jgi:hypothetical protein